MIAIEHNALTQEMERIGQKIRTEYERPKAILSVSAHWYTHGTWVQSAQVPKQVYDMYGFPEELYAVKYPVKGYRPLTDETLALLGDQVHINDDWGIDHGTWSVLVHMFPQADIPVVQLSVNGDLPAQAHFELGKKLAPLREQGYLIFASGNIVHNLRRVEWENPHGSRQADAFDEWIKAQILERKFENVIHYEKGPDAHYAVPMPDHYLPLLYALAAGEEDEMTVFNNVRNLGALSMTGYFMG